MTYNVSKVPAIIYKLTLAEPIIQTDMNFTGGDPGLKLSTKLYTK